MILMIFVLITLTILTILIIAIFIISTSSYALSEEKDFLANLRSLRSRPMRIQQYPPHSDGIVSRMKIKMRIVNEEDTLTLIARRMKRTGMIMIRRTWVKSS